MIQPPQQSTKGLEITGLVLSCIPVLALPGIVLSIIALVKTKSLRGTPSMLSIIGVVIGIFMSILTIAVIGTSWNDLIDEAKKEAFGIVGFQPDEQKQHSGLADIKDQPTTINNNTVTSPCFTFVIPSNYFLSKNPKATTTCNAQIIADNGSQQELVLLSITIQPQTGDTSKEKMRSAITAINDKIEIEDLTINGHEALKVVTPYHAQFMTPAVMYYIFDTSGRYQYNGKAITSYLIEAPGNGTNNPGLDSIIKTFTIR